MNTKTLNIAWKIMLFPCFLLMLPSTLQFFVPDLFVGIYLKGLSGMTPEQVIEINPVFWDIMTFGFQAIGFTVIGMLVLSIPILLIPFRRGEKWAVHSLIISWGFMWIVNLVFELKGSGELWSIVYSVLALLLLIAGSIISYVGVYKKNS